MDKIRIIFFASNPIGTNRLALDEEIRTINEKIRSSEYRENIELISIWATRPDDLLQAINQHKPDIVHFSNHGTDTGEILLTDKDGKTKPVTAQALKLLFSTAGRKVQVVLLNSCFSELQAEALSKIINVVIGMNSALVDEAAIAFASSFYRAIGFGRTVREAFGQGIASLLLEGIDQGNIPVLYIDGKVQNSEAVFEITTGAHAFGDLGTLDFRLNNEEPISISSGFPALRMSKHTEELRIDQFEIKRTISETGISFVYEVEERNGKAYILKKHPNSIKSPLDFYNSNLDPDFYAIPIETWEAGDYSYELIPFRRGWSLAEVIKFNKGRIGGNIMNSWTHELLQLLKGLHGQDTPIIFRDLKPENILVVPFTYRLVLLDLTSAVPYERGKKYGALGTSGYMAPEQSDGYPSPSSDLYSLAATLQKINSGKQPPHFFDRQRGYTKFFLNDVMPDIAALFPKIAAVDPKQRFSNAMDALDFLEDYRHQTAGGMKVISPVKFPSGESVVEKVPVGAGPTDVEV